MPKKISEILTDIGVSKEVQKLTEPIKKPKAYTRFVDTTPPHRDFNYQMDLIEMPKTRRRNKYLLVIVDLYTRLIDFQPISNKTPATVKKAIEKIFLRDPLNLPKYSMSVDGGSEFKRDVATFFEENDIWLKNSQPARKTQQAVVEAVNKTLVKLLFGYMNQKEHETGKTVKTWDEPHLLEQIKTALNKNKEESLEKKKDETYTLPKIDPFAEPKYQVGDYVYVKSEVPLTMNGEKQTTKNRRTGDRQYEKEPRRIMKILEYPEPVNHRYVVEGKKAVSYMENELLKLS